MRCSGSVARWVSLLLAAGFAAWCGLVYGAFFAQFADYFAALARRLGW